jgi:EAL domain-containing protein (putative c-di-GMP-specific phosphodiesterase class I)
MYRAKERGRARVELFDDDMRRRSIERLQLEQDLRRALLGDELEIHYQPLVSLCSDETVAVEALIRWRHPERGVVAPSEFVPVAEDSGLIVPLGAAVLERACRDIARWNAGAARPLTVGVNLSARQLSRDELADEVADVLARTGLAPEQLCLELTESTLLEDLESAVAALRRLRDLGVSIAIDDFGTGFSSLSYLTRFPVQQVKVDRTFVAGLGVDPGRTAVVTAVIGMAHALGLEVVAEGVETPEQRLELEVLGCDLGQGWHWSPALPVDELAGWLACRSAHVPK